MPALFSFKSKEGIIVRDYFRFRASISDRIFDLTLANVEDSQQIFSTELIILRFLGKKTFKICALKS